MKFKGLVVGGILLLLTGAYFTTYKILEGRANTLPVNSPRVCKDQAERTRPRVLVLGDSITHGRVSADYVALLDERHRGRFEFINAGINGHLAYQALQRLGPGLERCRPDAVLVMIGTNDVNATLSEKNRDRYMNRGDLPRSPDLGWYRQNLRAILEKVRAAEITRVAVYSLPMIGEQADSPENRRVSEYNAVIAAEARAAGVRVLPLFDRMKEHLTGRRISGLCGQGRYYVEAAVFQRYLMGRSWNEISETFGFHLTTDCLHFNEAAAALMADLAEPLLSDRE